MIIKRQRQYSNYSRFKTFYRDLNREKIEENKTYLSSKEGLEEVIQKAEKLYESDYGVIYFKESFPTKEEFVNYVVEGIKNKDPMVLYSFTKNARRQNLDEDAQCQYIKCICERYIPGLSIKLLPKGGSNSIFPYNGQILKSTKENVKIKTARTIDAKVEYNFLGKKYIGYITMKVTIGEGGGQNNVFEDVKSTNDEFIKINDPNIFTFSILDGDYWKRKDRMKQLYDIYHTKHNIIVSSDKFILMLLLTLIKWLKENFRKEQTETIISDLSELYYEHRIRLSKQ